MSSLSSTHHSFDIHLAEEYGVNEAIIIHHFQHWIGVNMRKKNGKKTSFREERWWTYQTVSDIAAHFPYLSESEVVNIIEKLCLGKGRRSNGEKKFEPVLMKGNFNKTPFDRTTWYSFVNQKKFTKLAQAKMEEGQSQNPNVSEPRPIPDTITDPKTNTKKNNVKENSVPPSKEGFGKKPVKVETLLSSLSQEQKEAHDKIVSYKPQLGDPPNSEDVCAWMLSLKQTPGRLVESLKIYEQDCIDAAKRGESIRSMGASIRAILNNPERKLRNVDYDLNKEFAESKAKEHKFLEIKKDYVKIRIGRKEEELNFNLPHISFFQALEGLIKDSFYHLETE